MDTLSAGCLKDFVAGKYQQQPVLQVMGCKNITTNESTRALYRLLVSDGVNFSSNVVLATHKLDDNTIIRLLNHVVTPITEDKNCVTILVFETLQSGTDVPVIGVPKPLLTIPPPPTINDPPIFPALSSEIISPISSLTPYNYKWVIRARVTNKTNIREWNNDRGDGILFNMNLLDESGEIKATAFNEMCQKHFHMIQVGKVYYISNGNLKMANPQFTNLKNEYEMTFGPTTAIEECVGFDDKLPKLSYNLMPLSQIPQMESNALVDVAGICREFSNHIQFTAKTSGLPLKKRDVTLVDRSGCTDFVAGKYQQQPVLQVMGCKNITTNESTRALYRLLVSDGVNFSSNVVLATHKLDDNTIIRLLNHVVTPITEDKNCVTILVFETLQSGTDVPVIGVPKPLLTIPPPPTINDPPIFPAPVPDWLEKALRAKSRKALTFGRLFPIRPSTCVTGVNACITD